MKIILISLPFLLACTSPSTQEKEFQPQIQSETKEAKPSEMEVFYNKNNQDSLTSESSGSVSNGKIKNSSLFPPKGNNYQYFDKTSYLEGRAFVHSTVKKILINSLKQLETECPKQQFKIMEIAHKNGGKLWPHRTHQKGTSVDFMLPKLIDGKINYSLDDLGSSHYFLDTDNHGKYIDSEAYINFETTAKAILAMHQSAQDLGWKISKVILKVELQDELFASPTGKKLRSLGIYFTQKLTPKVNQFHDDHFHVDFEKK